MKRALTLTLLAAASGACLAQVTVPNSIVLYGIIDVGVQNVSGYAGGSNTSLVSGIMDGSRIGLRGNEDLGGGYRALFTLENRTEANDGSVSNRPKSGSQVPDRFNQAALLGLPGVAATGGQSSRCARSAARSASTCQPQRQPVVSGIASSTSAW